MYSYVAYRFLSISVDTHLYKESSLVIEVLESSIIAYSWSKPREPGLDKPAFSYMEILNILCVEKMHVYLVSYSHEKNKRTQHYNLNLFNCKDQEKG